MKIKACLFAIFLTICFSCTEKKKEVSFPSPSEIEINEVIKAVVEQDSLNPEIPIQIELMDVKIWDDQNPNNPPPPLFTGLIELEDIVFSKPHHVYFSNKDTSYIRYQSTSQPELKINTSFFQNHSFLDTHKVKNLKKRFSDRYYRLTKPVFTLDHKKAYLQLELRCFGCGNGREFFLVKKKKKWKIAFSRETWIA